MERWKAVHISDVKKKKPSRCLIAEERKSLPLAEEMLRAKLKRKEVDFKQLSALYIYIYNGCFNQHNGCFKCQIDRFSPYSSKGGTERERENGGAFSSIRLEWLPPSLESSSQFQSVSRTWTTIAVS